MLEKPTDKRIVRTKRLIRDALTELMEEKGFEGITVRDLTQKAEINRGTFYLHYHDKYDLLEQSEAEILTEIQKIAQKINPLDFMNFNRADEPFPFIITLFELFQENSRFMKVILGPNGDASFQGKLKDFIKQTFYQNIMSKINTDHLLVPVDYLFAYVSSAHLGVIQHWLESGMKKSPREIAMILSRITFLGPRNALGLKPNLTDD
ncbi:TetR/AcrR family transcriptional regulator [Neobacillus sp. MER 74]|uniref:TetR/AcrR family transcriptional regulator n=1 Tax=Neobacillus sp. MER 74 TaxID=2939566 RepID=UPI00203C2B67|nr:TetR/AcrR family transcriptional regulator [Neobacillus sp. MER 74]MCM3115287.1 TetR/AcrR family transcriptional regulator [Neobacillus sp. MER 74]